MNERIKKSFDGIRAEDSLKISTTEYINGKRRERKSSLKLIPVAVAFILVFASCFFGYKIYSTPVTVLSVDINPSLELGINRFDKVVNVKGYNEDGSEFTSDLDIIHQDYKEAIEKISSSFAENEVISITVAGKDENKKKNVYSSIETICKDKENTFCESATEEEVKKAHEKGLSFGKYKAYLSLIENGYQITEEEIKDMPMKDIREKLNKNDKGHGKDETDVSGENGNGHGKGETEVSGENGNGHGKGETEVSGENGNGHGKGENKN